MVDAPAQNLLDGTPYRALHELGKGGMGSVHLAEHRILKKRIAVKLLHFALAGDAGLVDRLRVEAEVLATLSSPHVVQVLDCGVTGSGEPFIAMELLAGRSLQDELKARGSFPPLEAIDLVRQANKGVMAAHALGIIHRDLKPANLFYSRPDPSAPALVKVLDFGVAKIVSGPVAPPQVATAVGTMVGSPKTISPEACLGEPVDERSDIYSLGVVLYMLLTGRGPFEGRKDIVEYARAHVTEQPRPPSEHASHEIAPELDALVLELLEKDPNRRVQSAKELDAVLARMLETLPHSGDEVKDGGKVSATTEPLPSPPLPELPTADSVEDTAQAALRFQALRDAERGDDTATNVQPRQGPDRGSVPGSAARVIVTPPREWVAADIPTPSGGRGMMIGLVASLVVVGVGLSGYLLGKQATTSVSEVQPSVPSGFVAPAQSVSAVGVATGLATSPRSDERPLPVSASPLASATATSSSMGVSPPVPNRLPATAPKAAPSSKPVTAAPTAKPTSEFYE